MTNPIDLDKNKIDYIQRVYDDNKNSREYEGFVRGIEFVVLQLGLPIRIQH